MPDVGLEPTATSLRGWRSTDWANQANESSVLIELYEWNIRNGTLTHISAVASWMNRTSTNTLLEWCTTIILKRHSHAGNLHILLYEVISPTGNRTRDCTVFPIIIVENVRWSPLHHWRKQDTFINMLPVHHTRLVSCSRNRTHSFSLTWKFMLLLVSLNNLRGTRTPSLPVRSRTP